MMARLLRAAGRIGANPTGKRTGNLTANLGANLGGNLTDTLGVAGIKLGWTALRRMPSPLAYRLFQRLADITVAREGKRVSRLRSNYAKARPELDARELDRLVREGMRSYMRYYCEAFRLPDRSEAELLAATTCHGADLVRDELSTGQGVVVFVGHCGNFDQAGAWAASQIAPCTTVAERLKPEAVFQEFLRFREALQMQIIPLTGGPNPFAELKKAVAEGRFVCLAADRDLTSNGVEVDFLGHRARMAKGPAALSLLTGSPLHAATIHYEPDVASPLGGYRTVIDIGPRLIARVEGPTEARVADLIQQCADHLAGMIAEHTSSWHMLQRVFVEDLDPARRGSDAADQMASQMAARTTDQEADPVAPADPAARATSPTITQPTQATQATDAGTGER